MVDVLRFAAFSDGDKGGNPAGVAFVDTFPTEAEMRAIAKEVGYSETAFIVPQPGSNDQRWRVRYFSPESEVPFCGHATLAAGMAVNMKTTHIDHWFVLNGAEIKVSAVSFMNGVWNAGFDSPRTWSRQMSSHLAGEFLREFGLTTADLADGYPPMLANAGATHVVLALRDRAKLKAMTYKLEPMKTLMRNNEVVTVNLIFREPDGKIIHSRNAFASGGVYEDPATGAAAAALGGLLRDMGKLDFAGNAAKFGVHQGDDMNIPSRLNVKLGPQRGEPVHIGGKVRKIEPPQPAAGAQPAR